MLIATIVAGRAVAEEPQSPSGSSATPDVVEVTCDGSRTTVLTPTVKPQTDGYHFSVIHDASVSILQFWRVGGGSYGGFERDPAVTPWTTSFAVRPTSFFVKCVPTFVTGRGVPRGARAIDFVDPEGIYHPAGLNCSRTSLIRLSGPPLDGSTELPVDAIRRLLPDIRSDDVVEYTKFPEFFWRPAPYRVVRGDRVVATMRAYQDSAGDWHLDGDACASSGLGATAPTERLIVSSG